ncbi:MAG TPA: ribose 5-phosphate isomerase B [Gemmatimonadales bacterium]|nr:ribose 5-phosphate isomerase B [Gemmatimonadales bacterium]
MPEKIPIGADHAGFEMKQKLVAELKRLGYDPIDLGTNSPDSTDYPDYAHPVAHQVETGEAKRGILLCGTGLGMSYAANRHHGVRAAVVWNPEVAKLSRQHNDANILVLPARCISEGDAEEILKVWLATPFEGGRHQRRVAKIETDAS